MGIFDFFKKNKNRPVNNGGERRIWEKPDFSGIDIKNPKDYYRTSAIFNDRKVDFDLNFETNAINQKELDRINAFIEKIPVLDEQNRTYIKEDFQQDVSMTSDYLNFYLEEFDENELAEIINLKNGKKSRTALLLEELNLIRVGIYPQESYFAIFDYSIDIDGEPCNQLLVVNINEDGSLDYITWES